MSHSISLAKGLIMDPLLTALTLKGDMANLNQKGHY